MSQPEKERDRIIEALYDRYGSGSSGSAAKFRYWRKKWMWRVVVGGSAALKRLLDIVGSLIGLILFSPIFLVTAICIKIEDRGPVFFGQTRVGRHGKTFTMYKFRSMVVDADKLKADLAVQNEPESGGVRFKIRRDPRMTRVGRFIRKGSIDEMPQFYNVLTGDMSLVGPRPPVPQEVANYTLHTRYRLEVKPGITCLWQVGGRSELSFDQQVDLDRQYIESRSFWLDIVILLKTIPAVLSGRGAY